VNYNSTDLIGFDNFIGAGEENTNNLYTFYNMIDVTKTSASIFGIIQSYNFDGYTDWYIPCLEELKILYDNRVAIGNFDETLQYWSSNDQNEGLDNNGAIKDPRNAYTFDFATGNSAPTILSKSAVNIDNKVGKFRAIRYF